MSRFITYNDPVLAKQFRVRYTLSEIVTPKLSDEKSQTTDKLPGSIQSSGENHGGSNPTPGAF
jgi:hypothetical protein